MKRHPFTPCIGSLFLATLAFTVSGCSELFSDPPPRYNTVIGTAHTPVLNPGGEGPATIPLHQFEESDRYTTAYPSAEDMAALQEAQQGLPAPDSVPQVQHEAMNAPSPEMAEAVNTAQASAPQPAMQETSAAPASGRKRPLAMQGGQEEGLQAFPEEAEQAVPVSPVESQNNAPLAMAEPAPLPQETAPVQQPAVQQQPAPQAGWSDQPDAAKAGKNAYPKLSTVPEVPADVKAHAADTKASFSDVQKEGALQAANTAPAPVPAPAETELQRALKEEASNPPIATYQPDPVSEQDKIVVGTAEQPGALPAPASAEPLATPAPVPASAMPSETAQEPVAPMAAAPAEVMYEIPASAPLQPTAPAVTAPVEQAVAPAPAAPMSTAPAPTSPIANFQVPEEPVSPAPATGNVYAAPAEENVAPITLTPPSGMASTGMTLPPSRYAARRMGQANAGLTYRHN